MDLTFDAGLETFRQDVRNFIRDHLPPEFARRRHRKSFLQHEHDSLAWTRILHKQGWSVPNWPVEYGGPGWSAAQQFVFEQECAEADAPALLPSGLHMLGPVLQNFGTEQQKATFLPPIARGDYFWCQGYSEPDAGSDLASLRTTAVRDGDHYLVNGQKIWTSGATHAAWGFFLVKTDTTCKPQKGISFLMIDMSSPGISVREIPQFNGEAHVCTVFLDNVRVPVANRVGDEGAGWGYGKFLLDHERTASSYIFWTKRELQKLKRLAARELCDGVPVIDTPVFAQRLARVEAQVIALEWSVLRVLADEKTPWHPTAISSCLKVRGSQLQQAVTELQVQALGAKAMRLIPLEDHESFAGDDVWHDDVVGKTATALLIRAATIFGGSLQVQRDIIARLAFGI
ncbi:MAG: acyl-CoA dehydrogenase family protein [Spongiibacteraceae bacterium]